MASKDKEAKGFQEKLKNFFRTNKSGSGQFRKNDFTITQDIDKEIRRDSPFNHRMKAIKELSEAVLKNRLEEMQMAKLWSCVEDLISDNQSREVRHLVYIFITNLCKGQSERVGMLRPIFFKLVTKSLDTSPTTLPTGETSVEFVDNERLKKVNEEDLIVRFELLQALTENGKFILYIEEEIGQFLLKWTSEVTIAGKILEFLEILVNLVKFNAAYIDEEIVTGFVGNTYMLCCNASNQKEVVLACLNVLDAVICYSTLPLNALPSFIAALCHTVNHEAYCQTSWKIMRNLLGTNLGHAALQTMCRALQDPLLINDASLLRGAVFHINMGLWSRNRVHSLLITPTTVLPSFLKALNCNHPYVMFEVMLSIQVLINKQGYDLYDPAWDTILTIIETVILFIEKSNKTNVQNRIADILHETLTLIEQFVDSKQFNGSMKRVFDLIERCAVSRPESSVLRLVNYLSNNCYPPRHQWLKNLKSLMDRYYFQEQRTNVRVKVLEILTEIIKLNRVTYEDELIERIVIPNLQNVHHDSDVIVRNTVANLLCQLAIDCETKLCLELLEILDKLIKRPFEVYGTPSVTTQTNNIEWSFSSSRSIIHTDPAPELDLLDTKTAVNGLIQVFIVKLYRLPSTHVIAIYKIMLNHLEMHYSQPNILENCPTIRYQIFDTFLKIRANFGYHIGFPEQNVEHQMFSSLQMRYSPYLTVTAKLGDGNLTNVVGQISQSPPGSPATSQTGNTPVQQTLFVTGSSTTPVNVSTTTTTNVSANCIAPCVITQVSLKPAFKAVQMCLRDERDWEVFKMVISNVPKIMENKSLILSNKGKNKIDGFATTICNLFVELKYESLVKTPSKFTKADFHSYILPMLASLATYHSYLEKNTQKRIISCLFNTGFITRHSRQCINILTTCTLEMREVMVSLLPELLLELSKTSPTVNIATPILEFLLTLTRIPAVFQSFVSEQYMSVVAISSPYTNPFKYNHYIVYLAHHVISVWFLKCRLPFRRDLVTYIRTWLQTNVIYRFEEVHTMFAKGDLNALNEDSSNRKRSSSLTEQGSRTNGQRSRGQRSGTMATTGGNTNPNSSAAAARVAGAASLDLRPPIDEALNKFHTELTETCVDLMARYTYSPCSALPKRLPTADFLLNGGQSMTWLLGNMLITITTSGCSTKSLKQNGLCDKCSAQCKFEFTSIPELDRMSKSTLNRSHSGGDDASLYSNSNKATRQNSGNDQNVQSSIQTRASQESLNVPENIEDAQGKLEQLPNRLQQLCVNDQKELRPNSGVPSVLHTASSSIESNSLGPTSGAGGISAISNHQNSFHQMDMCICWCNGWAEIYIRRPTGDVSWVMRIQNQINPEQTIKEFPASELSTVFIPVEVQVEPVAVNENKLSDRTLSNNSHNSFTTSNSTSSSSKEEALRKLGSGTIGGLGASCSSATDITSFDCTENVTITEDKNQNGSNKNDDDNVFIRTSSVSGPINIPRSPIRQSGTNSQAITTDDTLDFEGDQYLDNQVPDSHLQMLKLRNPVRRSNSSPEMSASWKNPFLTQEKNDEGAIESGDENDEASNNETPSELSSQQKKSIKSPFTKDMRVSCEAIPEEISGLATTPPSVDTSAPSQHHLQSYHSYPGTTDEKNEQVLENNETLNETTNDKKSSTVPTSPTLLKKSNDSKNTSYKTRAKSLNIKSQSPPPNNSEQPFSPKTLLKHCQTDRKDKIDKEIAKTFQNACNLIKFNSTNTTTALDKPSNSNSTTNVFFGNSQLNTVNKNFKELELRPSSAILNDNISSVRRDRGYTISVMSGQSRSGSSSSQASTKPVQRIRRTGSPRAPKEVVKSGVNPSFVFLQLYHSQIFGTHEKPLLVSSQTATRSVHLLDTIPPYETHKIGVLYVGKGQCNNRVAILRNVYGSTRYIKFIQKLGTLIKLTDVNSKQYFLGGLEQNGKAGKFTYIWHDDIMQMIFHIATMMPNEESDKLANEKLKHIGNNFVTIVYNDSQEEYDIQTIRSQCNFACVVIEPLDHNTNRVVVKSRPDLTEHIGHKDPKVISDSNLPILVQQLALHANLASCVYNSLKPSSSVPINPYASNWLGRLRAIKRLRQKLQQEFNSHEQDNISVNSSNSNINNTSVPKDQNKYGKKVGNETTNQIGTVHIDDFTEYT